MARNSNGFLSTDTELIGFGGGGKEYSGASGIYVDNVNDIISITGDVGKEYNGIEPIVVNNEENLISANSAPIGVQEPLYFVQDDDEAVVIGLSGEYVTPSDITGKLDTSSFESWQQGQYTNDLTAINEKINEVSSNFEGYATEQWVEDKGYLTEVSIPESASWTETSEVVESNSGTWNTVSDKLDVTAQVISSCETSSVNDKTLVTKLNGNEIAVEYAGSARIADIALKDYQGNSFVPFYAKTSALEEKLDTTAFAEASGNFQPRGDYAERDFVLSSVESATSGKLDVSSFASVSGDFLTTSFGISESATWNETSDVVQSNSAQWGQGGGTGGDPEVNSFVYDNSATINEVNSSYQTNSGIYLRTDSLNAKVGRSLTGGGMSLAVGSFANASQYGLAIGEHTNRYVPTGWLSNARSNAAIGYSAHAYGLGAQAFGEVVVVSGGMAIGKYNKTSACSFVIGNGSGIAPTARSDIFVINYDGSVSAAGKISANGVELGAGGEFPISADEAVQCVQSNSAQWSEGGSIPVSNSGDFYKVGFDGVDLYGYKSTSSTPNYVFSAVSSQESTYLQYTPYPQWNNNAIYPFDWIGFDIISVSSNGNGIHPVHYPGGITALDVYYQAEYVYDYNNNLLPNFSGYVGQITLDNLVISSNIDKPSYFNDIARCSQFRLWFSGNEYEGQLSNNHYICSVGNEVQSGTNTLSGIIVPSTAGLASESYVQTNSAVLTAMIAEKQDTLTFGYDEQDRINSINNSALAGGGDVPEDVMVETNLGYNAVNEISAYNGSAIAQYGAEKQWLQHDDTIVSISNSAQYAFGCNVSALQRLMGIDETVLYENSAGFTTAASGMPLSEKADNFNKLKFVHYWNGNGTWEQWSETVMPVTNNRITLSNTTQIASAGAASNVYYTTNSIAFESTAHNKFVHIGGYRANLAGSNTSTSDVTRITKVIGIGRKQ